MSREQQRLRVFLADRLVAITADVSPHGFCAEMRDVFLPGSKVHGTIERAGATFAFRGEVAWASPGNLAHQVNSRFGVRFTAIEPGFFGERP